MNYAQILKTSEGARKAWLSRKRNAGVKLSTDTITGHAKDFLADMAPKAKDMWGISMERAVTKAGACSLVSEELVNYLAKKGVKAETISGEVATDRKMAQYAKTTANDGNWDGDFHTAVRIGSHVVDLTARQHGEGMPAIRITTVKQFESEWKTSTSSVPKPTVKSEYAAVFKGDPEDTGESPKTQCTDCLWRHQGELTCDAFPKGIPIAILVGAYDHTAYYKDGPLTDGGLTYTPASSYALKSDTTAPPVQLSAPTLGNAGNMVQSIHGFANVFKANPFHDQAGKFTSKDKASSSDWKKVGNQKGSNSGGVYERAGVKHYVKFPWSKGQVYAEQAADQVYELMGVETMQHKAIKVNGKTGSVSVMKDVQELGSEGWKKLNDTQKQQAANAYVASALTMNWDVVGLAHDNMGTTKEGNLAIFDTGGSFKYRAMGSNKVYSADPTPELENMLSKSKTSGRVFGPMMEENKELFVNAARKLKAVDDKELVKIASTMRDDTMGQTVLARKKAILDYFGVS
jgi:hypothetical protein